MRNAKARYRARHPERVRQQSREHHQRYYRKKHAEIRLRTRLYKYGLTAEELDAMRLAQEGRCDICSRELRGRDENVDHCHKTDKVRALLCFQCNNGLGCARDDPSILRGMIKYLEEHRAEG